MASDVVYDAVRAFVTAQWTGTTPIQWENEDFDQAADVWLAVEMSGAAYEQQSIGAALQEENRWDEEGLLWGYIFVPIGTGSSQARRYGKQFADLFRGTTLLAGSLEFLGAEIGLGEPSKQYANKWRLTVLIDWRRLDA